MIESDSTSGQYVLILGAKSDIAKALAHLFASKGYSIQLAARQAESLQSEKTDLELLYLVDVNLYEIDILDLSTQTQFLDNLPRLPEIVICVVGDMGQQEQSENDIGAAIKVMRTNYEGPACILSLLASRFITRGSGVLVGISSVAGLRGKASNYFYGSAKAGYTAFLSGLRNRLQGSGVHVLTVLPGFVATSATEKMDLPAPLTATPEELATAVWHAVQHRRNVIYVRRIWRLIMTIICQMPESLFKRTQL